MTQQPAQHARKVCHPPRTLIVTDLRDGGAHLTLVDVRQTVSIVLSRDELRALFPGE